MNSGETVKVFLEVNGKRQRVLNVNKKSKLEEIRKNAKLDGLVFLEKEGHEVYLVSEIILDVEAILQEKEGNLCLPCKTLLPPHFYSNVNNLELDPKLHVIDMTLFSKYDEQKINFLGVSDDLVVKSDFSLSNFENLHIIIVNDRKLDLLQNYFFFDKGFHKVKLIFTNILNNCYGMFCHCESLTSLDLSSFNTSSVTNMCGMFRYCES